MCGARPVNSFTAAMTGQTHAVLLHDRRDAALGKSYDCHLIERVQPMLCSRAMTGFTAAGLQLVPGVVKKQPGVNGMSPFVGCLAVTAAADLRARQFAVLNIGILCDSGRRSQPQVCEPYYDAHRQTN